MIVRKRIKNIGRIVTGNTPPTNQNEYYGNYRPFIKATDIGDSKYTFVTEESYSELAYEKYKQNVIPQGATCVVTIGSIGKKLTMAHTELFVNQAINAVIPNEGYDKNYVYYLLKYNLPQLKMFDSGTASGRENISKSSFSNIIVNVEDDKRIQHEIGSILSNYDNIIDNNNKRIKLLEQMTENLYKEWFVRFRFPGNENIDIVNGLPKGWERKKISFVYDTSSGGTPSRQHDEYYSNGVIPWIKTGELQDCILVDTEECITDDAVKHSSAKLIPANSVLMAMYGVNIGKLGYTSIEATCNQACCVFKDKYYENSRHYLFQYLKSIREYLLLIGFGAAQQNLSQDLIKGVKIVVPPKEVLLKFENLIEPLYNESKLLLKKNKNMIKQRDLLLPRLMSGKLEVK